MGQNSSRISHIPVLPIDLIVKIAKICIQEDPKMAIAFWSVCKKLQNKPDIIQEYKKAKILLLRKNLIKITDYSPKSQVKPNFITITVMGSFNVTETPRNILVLDDQDYDSSQNLTMANIDFSVVTPYFYFIGYFEKGKYYGLYIILKDSNMMLVLNKDEKTVGKLSIDKNGPYMGYVPDNDVKIPIKRIKCVSHYLYNSIDIVT